MAFLYIVECNDGSFYTGIAANIGRRLSEHLSHSPKAAKYTRSHPVKEVVALWQTDSLAHAAKGEYAVKRLNRKKKEALIHAPEEIGIICPSLVELYFISIPNVTIKSCLNREYDEINGE